MVASGAGLGLTRLLTVAFGAVRAVFGRVDTQIGCIGVLGADTARFFWKRAVFAAVLVVKSALYAF